MYIISENCFIKIASKHQYKEKWLERLAMEKSDKLDGSKGFEILYLCHPQTGQASKEAQPCQPEEGGKNKSRTLWGTTTTTRGSC